MIIKTWRKVKLQTRPRGVCWGRQDVINSNTISKKRKGLMKNNATVINQKGCEERWKGKSRESIAVQVVLLDMI